MRKITTAITAALLALALTAAPALARDEDTCQGDPFCERGGDFWEGNPES